MIQGIRNHIGPILDQAKRQGSRDNLSLYLNKLCRDIDDPNKKEHGAKEETLKSLLRGYTPDTLALYRRAFKEWIRIFEASQDSLCFEMETTTPLIVGKGDQNVHEFGISLQTPWGTPVIPGTAVKGVLSSFAAGHGDKDWQKGSGPEKAGQYGLAMFGGTNPQFGEMAGGIRFMDAWWVPNTTTPFMEDIINVHCRSYYQQGQWPHGMDSPVPNSFLTIKPGQRFLFAVQGPEDWCNLARELLKAAAGEQGFGSKTRVGYGRLCYCKTNEELQEEIREFDDNQLAALFSFHAGNFNLRENFAKECNRREYSPVLHSLFNKFRPAAVLLAELTKKPALLWKNAKSIRKQFSSQLPAGKIDTTTPDIQAIFKLCRPLVPNGDVEGTWLASFAPSAEDMLAGKTAQEIETLLLDYKEAWPPLKDFRNAIEKHPGLSKEERDECLAAYDLRKEDI